MTNLENNDFIDRPPMGWNSFDCFNASVTEAEIKEHTDILAATLLRFGWEYIVVDFCWSHPAPKLLWAPDQIIDENGNHLPRLEMDKYGRLLPSPNRFPSSANGNGFKPLADYIHSKGLKFGIHIMRGIPRQAVKENSPILKSKAYASDIADMDSTCKWLNHMYGLDMSKKASQKYYDSIFQLYASWDVDLIKADDMSYPYHREEIEAVCHSIQNCGRAMILSLSPGPTPINQATHIRQHANMWRIASDFFDSWEQLKDHLAIAAHWGNNDGLPNWADVDILPLGWLELRGPISTEPHMTRFTRDEQYALMTLSAILPSPLMMGGHLPSLDDFTFSLLSNEEVLAVNQYSTGSHQYFKEDNMVAWVANKSNSVDKYLAIFNIGDSPNQMTVVLTDVGFHHACQVRDLWARVDLGFFDGKFVSQVNAHGARLYCLHEFKS